MDLYSKKTFLQQGSELYARMIQHTENDVLRRFLAFRIIVNAMAFEDVVGNRAHPRMRQIRNVLLAHKQEQEFFEGFRAVDEITDGTISPLLAFMAQDTGTPAPAWLLPELSQGLSAHKFALIVPQILDGYEAEFLSGNRVINNFLCFTGSNVHEVSSGELAGAFYRYHSSKALFDVGQYIFNNSSQSAELIWLSRHAKLDMLLHGQNMADSAIKDTRNSHSIDGILEVLVKEGIGDAAALQTLAGSPAFASVYGRVRTIRNKLIGHMDHSAPLADLVAELDALSIVDAYDLCNMVDEAVDTVARSHMAIWSRYVTGNQVLPPTTKAVMGITTRPYF